MNLKSITEFHKLAPEGATHVLKLGDKYEYAWFDGHWFNGQSPVIDLSKAFEPNNGFYFKVGDNDWSVYMEVY